MGRYSQKINFTDWGAFEDRWTNLDFREGVRVNPENKK